MGTAALVALIGVFVGVGVTVGVSVGVGVIVGVQVGTHPLCQRGRGGFYRHTAQQLIRNIRERWVEKREAIERAQLVFGAPGRRVGEVPVQLVETES